MSQENAHSDHPARQSLRLSPLDEQRFGFRTARADDVEPRELPEILEFCRREAVRFLVARCSVTNIGAVEAMEEAGFHLMDTLVYYERNLDEGQALPTGNVRTMAPAERGEVEGIAKASFRNYSGHYHADPRLDRALSDEAYVSWARRCMSGEAADVVLVAEADGTVGGFAALRMVSPMLGDLVLGAVAPASRGRGLYRMLALASMEWCRRSGAKQMMTSTHINNFAAQKAWIRAGMRPARASYTFHKWFP